MRKTILFIVAMLFCMGSFAQNKNFIYVYRNSDDVQIGSFFRNAVDSITFSMLDVDEKLQSDYVTQRIYTHDGVFSILLNEIDSVKFVAEHFVPGEPVDLGLSVKWASYNVGASVPEEWGGLYGWADSTGVNTSVYYTDYPNENPPMDISNTPYDIARAKWGDKWRMPTTEEMAELVQKCTYERVVVNGNPCAKFTGPNGNSILLPVAGSRLIHNITEQGKYGYYWSSTLYEEGGHYAYDLMLDDTYSDDSDFNTINTGMSVRPVYNAPKPLGGEPIDLGLSVKWANYNIGASSEEEVGGLYGWGDITGELTSTELDDYPNATPPENISGTSYDLAKAKWGSDWRMPTSDEIKELTEKCKHEWTTVNGVTGVKFTAENGNSIFIPASGYRYGQDVYSAGSVVRCWSGTLSPDFYYRACYLDCDARDAGMVNGDYRYKGFSIRPVSGALPFYSVITDDVTELAQTTATMGGQINGISGKDKDYKIGICYSELETFEASDENFVSSDAKGEGAFTLQLTNLKEKTLYYYRACLCVDGKFYCGSKKSFKTLKTEEKQVVADMVDLGLSVKWAGWNIGAKAAEQTGGLYGWGDVTGDNTSTNLGEYPTETPPANISATAYDIARAKWGGNWRMPTAQEISELTETCKHEWTTINGVTGMKFTADNGNSIFIPAAGYRYGEDSYSSGSTARCWSGTLSPEFSYQAAYLDCDARDAYMVIGEHRYKGLSVRAVYASSPYVILTGGASKITQAEASISLEVAGIGKDNDNVKAGVCYSISDDVTAGNDNTTLVEAKNDGTLEVKLSDLKAGTTYNYRACLLVDGVYYYGSIEHFTTEKSADKPIPGEAVDLGLSVKWANYNLGATKASESGGLYGWADPTGEKRTTVGDDYPSANPPSTICGTEYDLAHVLWGGDWRLPTNDEIKELLNNCLFEWVSVEGIRGAKFTAKNGNSIFLPAAGIRSGFDIHDFGEYGYYWSGVLSADDKGTACNLDFFKTEPGQSKNLRQYGLSIRPVTK